MPPNGWTLSPCKEIDWSASATFQFSGGPALKKNDFSIS